MTLFRSVGSFNIDTGLSVSETQTISGLGFQPSLVLLWWSGSTATGDSVAGGDASWGFGAAVSSSSRWCVSLFSEDAQATSDSYGAQRTDEVIHTYLDGAYITDGIMDFSAMTSDGFTLVVDNDFSVAWRVSYLALGGTDLTNIALGAKQRDADLGNCSVTGLGFQPDFVLIVTRFLEAESTNGSHAYMSIGMATGASNQGCVGLNSATSYDTSYTERYAYSGEIMSLPSVWGGCTQRDAFVQFDSGGWTLNQLEGTGQTYYYYVAIEGGQHVVGDIQTRTDSNDINETTGFQPGALLFVSDCTAENSQDNTSAHNRCSIGAAIGPSNRACTAWSDEDGLDDTEVAVGNSDSAVYYHIVDDALEAAMDLKETSSTGFTCVMDNTETSAAWVLYWALGAETAAGVPRQMMHYARLRRAA